MNSSLKSCESCGEPVRESRRRYCSYACSNGYRRRVSYCPVCGSEFHKRSKTCSRECAHKLRSRTILEVDQECSWCGEVFRSGTIARYCEGPHENTCEVCGDSFAVDVRSHVPRTCSSECAGVLVNSEESWAKRRETSLRNWGTEFPQQSIVVREKIEDSFMDRYGVSSPLASPELRAKGWETFSRNVNTGFHRLERVSKVNRSVAELLAGELSTEVLFEKPLGRFSVDLFLPELGVYVDVHPTISHNTYRSFHCVRAGCLEKCEKHPPIGVDYHQKRAFTARELGVPLVQVYEWDDLEEIITLVRELGEGASRFPSESGVLSFDRYSLARGEVAAPEVRWHRPKSGGLPLPLEEVRGVSPKDLLSEGFRPVPSSGLVRS